MQQKKLNKIINDNKINDNKIIDDNDNDSDFYCISIIVKLKNAVTIKDINSILKINKKKCVHKFIWENVILLIKMIDNFLD